jgi:hypothetical protein
VLVYQLKGKTGKNDEASILVISQPVLFAAMEWSVAIFSSRESAQTLSASIGAVLNATKGVATTVDVIVNGNRDLANQAGLCLERLRDAERRRTSLRVWHIPLADKAHAWNQYLQEIWRPSDIAFFVDGYVQVKVDALKLMSDGLNARPNSFAASGLPKIGRSANKLTDIALHTGGIHGNLHAVRGDFMGRLRAANFRLPLGLYRVDGILGAVICFALDPAKNDWETDRIFVDPRATWIIRPLNWKSLKDIRIHTKRMMRQAQGVLENLAVREHLAVQKKSPQSLPRTSAELVGAWTKAFPRAAWRTCARNPLCLVALNKLRRPRDWSQASVPPLLVSQVIVD